MIRDNLSRLKAEIASACLKANRNLEDITLVAVAKGRGSEQISQAIACGISDIGENRVQEAAEKYGQIGPGRFSWHLVGHLQGNKVKEALKIFELIHSVDSLNLAVRIDKQAAALGKVQDILVQVNVSDDPAKFGLKAEEALEAIRGMAGLKNIRIKGLMTIAPLSGEPEDARPHFRMLRQLKDKANELRITDYELRILSMGMSEDFRIAIEEGSNMLRIGRAIFEG